MVDETVDSILVKEGRVEMKKKKKKKIGFDLKTH